MATPERLNEQLQDAVYGFDIETARALLERGANINSRGVLNQTVLMIAITNHYKEMVELLLSKGAAINVTDNEGFTALTLATSSEYVSEEIVDLLLQKNADTEKKSHYGRTAIHFTAIQNRPSIINRLVSFGATVDIDDEHGKTPLWWAVRNRYVNCVDVLLSVGANPLHKSKSEGSPLDVAKRQGHDTIVKKLNDAVKYLHPPKPQATGLSVYRQSGGTSRQVFNGKTFQPEDLKYDEDGDYLGSGGFAEVFRAVIQQEGKDVVVALKKPLTGGSRFTEEQMHELRKEADILLAIPPNDHIVEMIGFCDHPRHCALVLEFVDGGNLNSLLLSSHNPDSYLDTWKNRLVTAHQIADGMNLLHSLNPPVIHRDLKPLNILVKKTSPHYVCKISDFGLSKIRATSSENTRRRNRGSLDAAGTSAYIAPERFGAQRLDLPLLAKSDVYSYGVILWQIRERKQPFADEMDVIIRSNVKAGVPFLSPTCSCPSGYDKLTNHCCKPQPTDRPAFADVKRAIQKMQDELE